MTNIPIFCLQFIQYYYAIRWIIRKQNRNDFIKYYRLTLSVCGSVIFICLAAALCDINDDRYKFKIFYAEFGYILFCIIQMVFVELHMRYLDSVNFTRNQIKKNQLILQGYLHTINSSNEANT